MSDGSDFCRVCFGEAEPERKVHGHLVAPCNCTGSVKYMHLYCLRTWQATQRAQGRHNKAHLCELCGCKYELPQQIIKQEAEARSLLQSLHLTLKRTWHWLSANFQGPFSHEALRYWRNALLVSTVPLHAYWSYTMLMLGCCSSPDCTRHLCGE